MQPVVVEDGQRNWTAGGVFSFDFFTRIYGGGEREREGEGEGRPAPGTRTGTSPDCQFFPYETDFHDLAEVFRMEAGRAGMEGDTEPWYIGWSNCNSSVANILRQHYKRPYFIPTISESSKMDWIFMGVPGHGAHMHIDDVDNPSWQAQIRGTKHWRLEPPAECYYECPLLETVVYPGQIIVLDTNKWFHETHILGEELSITIGSEYD
ncbi:uncharacterized protein LOC121850166 [Callorhinchus milii]|nr:uncharacterized protein LOC121850166 [Callorhinchus milii]